MKYTLLLTKGDNAPFPTIRRSLCEDNTSFKEIILPVYRYGNLEINHKIKIYDCLNIKKVIDIKIYKKLDKFNSIYIFISNFFFLLSYLIKNKKNIFITDGIQNTFIILILNKILFSNSKVIFYNGDKLDKFYAYYKEKGFINLVYNKLLSKFLFFCRSFNLNYSYATLYSSKYIEKWDKRLFKFNSKSETIEVPFPFLDLNKNNYNRDFDQFLYLGNLDKSDGIYEVIKIIDILNNKHGKNKKLISIGGEISQIAELKSFVQKLNLENHIIFYPFCENLNKFHDNIFKSSYAFAYYQNFNSYSMVENGKVLYYLNFKIPVITSSYAFLRHKIDKKMGYVGNRNEDIINYLLNFDYENKYNSLIYNIENYYISRSDNNFITKFYDLINVPKNY